MHKRTVILGPGQSLHDGVHGSLADNPPPGLCYSVRDADHVFLFPDGHFSPYHDFHWGEFVDFGPGSEVVHTHRLPVLGRADWVTDTDDLQVPLICGRHALNPTFREAYRKPWTTEFARDQFCRTRNMLTAYTHPSCRGVLFRSHYIARHALAWLSTLRHEDLEERFHEKVHVLYPAQAACAEEHVKQKWTEGPLRIIFCGGDYDGKNGALALRVMARLLESCPALECVYIGNIPPDQQEKHSVRGGRILFFKSLPREDVLEWFARSHVLFHPSKLELMGTVFLEAMAAGLAVTVAKGQRMSHVTEVFGEDGALFVDRDRIPETDEEQAFEAHLRWLIENRSQAEAMGHRNWERAAYGEMSIARRDETLRQVYDTPPHGHPNAVLTWDQLPHVGPQSIVKMTSAEIRAAERAYWSEIGLNAMTLVF